MGAMTRQNFCLLAALIMSKSCVPAPGPGAGAGLQDGSGEGGQLKRFKIVNGTPELARNIMLLDTALGGSWELCNLAPNVAGWCGMEAPGGRLNLSTKDIGRYEVINGTPGMTRNIMLIDRKTSSTWLFCDIDSSSAWCPMGKDFLGEQMP